MNNPYNLEARELAGLKMKAEPLCISRSIANLLEACKLPGCIHVFEGFRPTRNGMQARNIAWPNR